MIVFDASTLVGAALKSGSIPEQALLLAAETDVFALSHSVLDEFTEVLARPKLLRALLPERRALILITIRASAAWFDPTISVADCRDAKDNQYLELALASAAEVIVSSDHDLLVLDPWRGIRILRPAAYLTAVAGTKSEGVGLPK